MPNKLKETQTSAIIIMDQENEISSANNIEESFRTTPEEEDEVKLTDQLNNDDDSETPSVHGFLNITVNNTIIERPSSSEEMLKNNIITSTKKQCCEGSDSGVEVLDSSDYRRTLSCNSTVSQEGENISVRSRDSSISYCSNYEDAYNILVRRNSTLLEDYSLRNNNNHHNNNGDVTSENGSESSSLSGSQTRCRRSAIITVKKKSATITTTPPDRHNKKEISKEKCNNKTNKPPITPCRNASSANLRLKSVDRLQGNKTAMNNSPRTNNSVSRTKQVPNSLDLAKNPKKSSNNNTTRPNLPTCSLTCSLTKSCIDKNPSFNKSKQLSQIENKTIEKYATLPRRRKEKADDKKIPLTPPTTTTTTIIMKKSSNKETPPSRMMFSSLYLPKTKIRTKIFHETNTQTALTLSDMENALAGKLITSKDPEETEKCTKSIQVDMRAKDVEKLKEHLKKLTEKYDLLSNEHKMQNEKLQKVESELKQEKLESKSLKEELKTNLNRILAILGRANDEESQEEIDGTHSSSGDSLLVLESRFQNVSKVIIQQEEEIAKLNNYVRLYEINLGKSQEAEKMLQQKHQDLETESQELQEFLQAEKSTICDALKEAETEIKNYQLIINQKDEELKEQREESKQFSRLCEQRRLENLGFQARIANFEAKSRELLVQQGSSVSGASVALASLIERLNALADELIAAYNISEQELEDVIYHNEVYKNSSSSIESTPEKSNKIFDDQNQLLTPNGKSGSSFVSAVINAIKNAAVGRETTSDHRKNSLFDRSISNELLDSETEPCLMMEHVLEDVVIPDGHSHNMISSGHGSMSLSSRLTQSESMKEVSNLYFSRQQHSEPTSLNTSYNSDIFSISEFMPPISLVDQVIDVDNVITRLLKVIRIIQIENEDCMSELQDQRDNLTEQVDQQKETNKLIVKQLKDWEVLGSRLKSEVKELMNQLSKKTSEIDSIKTELTKQREEIEKLNQDVCDLSTALAKAELEIRIKEDEAENALNKYQRTEEIPSPEILAKIIITYKNEVPELKNKLAEKEKYLNELNEEFQIGKKILGESLKQAVNEAKRQYDAIDHALEVLNSLQSVVQQCPILAKLQRDLEEISFQSASTLPIITPADFNANAGLGPVVANLEIAPTINTTA